MYPFRFRLCYVVALHNEPSNNYNSICCLIIVIRYFIDLCLHGDEALRTPATQVRLLQWASMRQYGGASETGHMPHWWDHSSFTMYKMSIGNWEIITKTQTYNNPGASVTNAKSLFGKSF